MDTTSGASVAQGPRRNLRRRLRTGLILRPMSIERIVFVATSLAFLASACEGSDQAGSGGAAGAATGGAAGSVTGGGAGTGAGGAAGGATGGAGGSGGATGGAAGSSGAAGSATDAGDSGSCQDLGTACTAPAQCCSNKCGTKGFCCGVSGTACQTDNDCCPGTCKADTSSPTGKRCKLSA